MKHLRGVSVRYSEVNLLLLLVTIGLASKWLWILSLSPNDPIAYLIANPMLLVNEIDKYRPVLHYKNKLNILQHKNHLINLYRKDLQLTP